MQSSSILSAVFATLGEDLDASIPFAEIDMNLAIFSVDLVFTAVGSPAAHIKAVLDASSLQPCLSANLGA